MTHPHPTAERYHAFDALRAAMMILGVAIHSATAYSTFPDVWWLKDPATSRWADLLILFLHSFRLPAFFVMSGFFAAMLLERRGWQGFLENRTARLGLPFLLCMLTTFPILKLSSVYSHFLDKDPNPVARVLGWIAQGRFERSVEPMHLWFLEVLMWVCLLFAALAPRLNRWLGAPWFGRLLGSRMAPAVFALVTFVTLLPMELGILDTPHNFAPQWRIIAAYAVFFGMGWGLYLHRAMLPRLRRGGWGLIAICGLLLIVTLGSIERQLADRTLRNWPAFLTTALTTALSAWLMIFGLIGLFLRYCSEASPRQRYLADSAYWLYLMHPPVLVLLQMPMMALPLPVGVKFALGFGLAVPILLWSYDRFVRASWVGVVLNGRRYERGFPAAQPALVLQPAAD
jgi:peptidoglycan/LPS O-acetylase OafA/YrhL